MATSNDDDRENGLEYMIHRLRVGDWVPSPVQAVVTDPMTNLVAVGRTDGDIEIHDPSSKWHVVTRIPGKTNFRLQGLVWTPNESGHHRLFGISLRGFIFEANLSQLAITNINDAFGGAAWSICASPRNPILAVGCEDGSVKLFDYSDNRLTYRKSFPSTGSRVLSLAYHPKKAVMYLGCADGTIRCVDENTGSSHFRMTGHLSSKLNTYILSMAVLSDSTVVTGDNHGHVQFWDGEAGVQIISFHQHHAEIRTIVYSADETQVFASGVDSRVTSFRRVVTNNEESESAKSLSESQWVYTTSHRPHLHDVYALAITKQGNQHTLVSGGLDGKLCLYSVNEFAKIRPNWVLPVPTSGLMQCATVSLNKSDRAAILPLKHRTSIDIWSVLMKGSNIKTTNKRAKNDSTTTIITPPLGESSGCTLSTQIQFKSSEHFQCLAISADGKYMAVSGVSGTRLWRLQTSIDSQTNSTVTVETVKCVLPSFLSSNGSGYCHAMSFSADSRRLAVSMYNGRLLLLDLNAKTNNASVILECDHSGHVREKYETSGSTGRSCLDALEFATNSLTFSADGQYVAVTSAMQEVYIYDTDRLRLHWQLPKLPKPITSLVFHPRRLSSLVVLMASNEFMTFDIESKELSKWSKENFSKIPNDLKNIATPLCGLSFDSSCDDRLILFGQSSIVHVNMSMEIPEKIRIVSSHSSSQSNGSNNLNTVAVSNNNADSNNKKRKQSDNGTINFASVHTYRSMIYAACLENSQMIVVENPWVRVLERMPDVVSRKRYGT